MFPPGLPLAVIALVVFNALGYRSTWKFPQAAQTRVFAAEDGNSCVLFGADAFVWLLRDAREPGLWHVVVRKIGNSPIEYPATETVRSEISCRLLIDSANLALQLRTRETRKFRLDEISALHTQLLQHRRNSAVHVVGNFWSSSCDLLFPIAGLRCMMDAVQATTTTAAGGAHFEQTIGNSKMRVNVVDMEIETLCDGRDVSGKPRNLNFNHISFPIPLFFAPVTQGYLPVICKQVLLDSL